MFEWPKEGKPPKQPYALELSSGTPLLLRDSGDAWKDKDGHWLQSFAIVTTEANELISRIHPRMPVILHSRDYDRWLDRGDRTSPKAWKCRRNPKVNNVRKNGPEMMRAAAKAAEDGELPL
ncbi:SOS response-associated peptidase family protein [Terriglobus sp.]|uniref:SOS response-associated peptidase family protein n=1 Tax=Terriglobus sp. TaxID=1889013 RepID=UPI003B006763